MDLKKIEYEDVDWIEPAEDTCLVKMQLNTVFHIKSGCLCYSLSISNPKHLSSYSFSMIVE
jgi:hypothetical protein